MAWIISICKMFVIFNNVGENSNTLVIGTVLHKTILEATNLSYVSKCVKRFHAKYFRHQYNNIFNTRQRKILKFDFDAHFFLLRSRNQTVQNVS